MSCLLAITDTALCLMDKIGLYRSLCIVLGAVYSLAPLEGFRALPIAQGDTATKPPTIVAV
jgi:hypothetical protein